MKELEYTTQSVPKDKRFCTICGKVKRLHYFEGDSTHCSACCEKMLHTRVPLWSVPVVLVLLAVAAAAVILTVQTVPYCMQVLQADAALRDNRPSDACSDYVAAISDASARNTALLSGGDTDDDGNTAAPTWTLFEAGTRTWLHYLQAYAEIYSEYNAAVLAESSLDMRTAADLPQIARLSEAKQAYEQVETFVDSLEEKYPIESQEDMLYDELIADLTAYADASESLYVKGYMEYYKGTATQYFKPDDHAAATAYYEKMLEYLPYEFMTAYKAEGESAMQAGDYAAAIKAYEKILEKNKNYTAAYTAIAEAASLAGDTEKTDWALSHFAEDDPMRLQLEMRYALRCDDLVKAANVHEKAQTLLRAPADQIFNTMLAEQTISQSNAQKLMNYVQYALYDAAFSLVKGDTEAAFETAYGEAFNYVYYYAYITNDSSAMTQSVSNMATLCASLAGKESEAGMVEELLPCDEATQQVIDGKMTVREVFVEGKAELI